MAFASLQNCRFTLTMSGDATILSTTGFGNNPGNSLGNQIVGGVLQLGTGSGQVNTIISYVYSIPFSGAQTIIISNSLTDICNEQNVTVARVRGLCIELWSPAQNSQGTNCSSITVTGGGVSPWTAILSNTSGYTINNGAWWAHGDQTTTSGMPVVAGSDHLVITNNDNANLATVRFSLFAGTQ